jgi:hypothetical protein
MTNTSDPLQREKRTVTEMLHIYCGDHHGTQQELCTDCDELLAYALKRLDCCPFGADKPVCSKCHVHCYRPEMREKIHVVMRYAGPRMAWKHPVMAVRHLLDKAKPAPDLKR